MRLLFGLLGLAVACNQARSADPTMMPMQPQGQQVLILTQGGAPTTPQTPPRPAGNQNQNQNQAPQTDAFSQGPPSGTEMQGGFNPGMLGDSLTYIANTQFVINGSSTNYHVPVASFGAFKITDDESPRPMDRVYINYDGFSRVGSNFNGPGGPSFQLNREVFGVEKIVPGSDDRASIGLRAPIFQFDGSGVNNAQFGDLTLIAKFAFWRDCDTGSLLSGGVAVTVPTGDNLTLADGSDHNPTLIQPYVGWVMARNDVYFQGFSSFLVPTDSSFGNVWFLDAALGYVFRRDCADAIVTGIAPALEAHLTVPTGHIGSDATGLVAIPNELVMTGALNVLMYHHSTLTAGLDVPVTGPRPYALEWVVQMGIGF